MRAEIDWDWPMRPGRQTSRRCVVVAAFVVASIAGCGADDQSSAPEAPTASSTATATPVAEETPAATPTAPPTPTPSPTPIAVPSPTPSPTPTGIDLRTIDWLNYSYLLPPCAATPSEQLVEVTLVDGSAEPNADNDGFSYFLIEVIHGSMGEPAQPVAAVMLAKIGASSFPSVILIYGGSGAQEELLGAAAGILDETRGDCSLPPADPDAHLWEAQTMQVTDEGLLVMTGEGWADAPHCCPDLAVVSTVALGDDGMLVEVEHSELPR